MISSAKKLSSIESLKAYGVSRSEAMYITNNFWNISEEKYKNIFTEYYLLRWSKKYFIDSFKEGTILRAGITYDIIYYRTDPVKIKNHNGDLFLSFRILDSVYNINPTVLVTLAAK